MRVEFKASWNPDTTGFQVLYPDRMEIVSYSVPVAGIARRS